MIILNLTQHPASLEQLAAGVVDPDVDALQFIKDRITFDSIPIPGEMERRAADVADMAAMYALNREDDSSDGPYPTHAMIGGAPFFMSVLEAALMDVFITPLYAFSVRESAEQEQPDGSVRKVAVFKHLGFVQAGNL